MHAGMEAQGSVVTALVPPVVAGLPPTVTVESEVPPALVLPPSCPPVATLVEPPMVGGLEELPPASSVRPPAACVTPGATVALPEQPSVTNKPTNGPTAYLSIESKNKPHFWLFQAICPAPVTSPNRKAAPNSTLGARACAFVKADWAFAATAPASK